MARVTEASRTLGTHVFAAVGGGAALALAMGVGRFSYTPIIPLMKDALHLSTGFASLLASANYLGYFLGAIISRQESLAKNRTNLAIAALIASTLTTGAMALTTNENIWLALRLVSGIASAIAFVYSAGIILDRAAQLGKPSWNGIFFSGVGSGIALTALVMMLTSANPDWRLSWMYMTALSVILLVPALIALQSGNNGLAAPSVPTIGSKRLKPLTIALNGAFLAEGIGYIIPATFIVLFLAKTPGLQQFSNLAWLIVGVAAIPSIAIWNRICTRRNRFAVISFAMIIQGLGVLAPVLAPNILDVVFAAVTLGGTFVAISSMVFVAGRELEPGNVGIVAVLTAAFSVGQISGPLFVAQILSHGGRYNDALWFATIVLLLGGIAVTIVDRATRKKGLLR
ncbi:MAG: YbfB/YjiJ family MFS transporter [Candidatus Eremiobacteraeota bacterium]|nr:YbfB/YjiJ family MFS transporter [Candidatus Eremiobacteraeota bacterium]